MKKKKREKRQTIETVQKKREGFIQRWLPVELSVGLNSDNST